VEGEPSWRKYRMLSLDNLDKHYHVIDDERQLDQVRVSICYESESEATCGNYVDATEGKDGWRDSFKCYLRHTHAKYMYSN